MKNIGNYAKGIVAVAGGIITSLQPYYGGQHWFVALTAGLTAVVAILIPNAPKS